MHLTLYRSERPEVFDEIMGQGHIVRILKNQIKKGEVNQAYLFEGVRGTGKTTTARILAKAVNCLDEKNAPCGKCSACEAIRLGKFLDVIELDAASNNGVDAIRRLSDSVMYPPVAGRKKVYIIDEVHMLSASAQNAFLKTLEEPPENVMFILATTNPEKILPTIKSRCMILNFKRISESEISAGMKRICEKRGIFITDEALNIIAAKSDGSVRDALTVLEQCISTGETEITSQLVLDYTGSAGTEFFLALTDAVIDGDASEAMTLISEVISEGKDPKQLIVDWLVHFRDLLIVKYVKSPGEAINASDENVYRLKMQAKRVNSGFIENGITILSEYSNLGRYSTQPRILLEVAIIRFLEYLGISSDDSHLQDGCIDKGSNKKPDKNDQHKAATGMQLDTCISVEENNINSKSESKFETKFAQKTAKVEKEDVSTETKIEVKPEIEKGFKLETEVKAKSGNVQEVIGGVDISQEAPLSDRLIETVEKIEDANQTQSIRYNEMWENICHEVDPDGRFGMFTAFVANAATVVNYENGEVTVAISPKRKRYIDDFRKDIEKAVRKLYGDDTLLKVIEGDVSAIKMNSFDLASGDESLYEIDVGAEETARDISNLFGGMNVNIE